MQIGKIKWDHEPEQTQTWANSSYCPVHNYATALANFKCVSLVSEYV